MHLKRFTHVYKKNIFYSLFSLCNLPNSLFTDIESTITITEKQQKPHNSSLIDVCCY